MLSSTALVVFPILDKALPGGGADVGWKKKRRVDSVDKDPYRGMRMRVRTRTQNRTRNRNRNRNRNRIRWWGRGRWGTGVRGWWYWEWRWSSLFSFIYVED